MNTTLCAAELLVPSMMIVHSDIHGHGDGHVADRRRDSKMRRGSRNQYQGKMLSKQNVVEGHEDRVVATDTSMKIVQQLTCLDNQTHQHR